MKTKMDVVQYNTAIETLSKAVETIMSPMANQQERQAAHQVRFPIKLIIDKSILI